MDEAATPRTYLAFAAVFVTVLAWASAFPLIRIALGGLEPVAAGRRSLLAGRGHRRAWLLIAPPGAARACRDAGIFLLCGARRDRALQRLPEQRPARPSAPAPRASSSTPDPIITALARDTVPARALRPDCVGRLGHRPGRGGDHRRGPAGRASASWRRRQPGGHGRRLPGDLFHAAAPARAALRRARLHRLHVYRRRAAAYPVAARARLVIRGGRSTARRSMRWSRWCCCRASSAMPPGPTRSESWARLARPISFTWFRRSRPGSPIC